MNVTIAAKAGFCFGVKRAIKLATETARQQQGTVYTLGPIIHNPQMVAHMEERGIKCVDRISRIRAKNSVLIIRSHGISPRTFAALQKKEITVVDATCPLVKKLQQRVELLRKEKYKIIIIGEANHPEVKVLKELGGPGTLVMKNDIDLKKIKVSDRIGVVAQTTLLVTTLQQAVAAITAKAREVKVYNTICDATIRRQQAAAALAGHTDLILVVGGKNSSNTNRLAEVCRASGKPAYHIETAQELKRRWFNGKKAVGITAGASTPDWIIAETVKEIRNL